MLALWKQYELWYIFQSRNTRLPYIPININDNDLSMKVYMSSWNVEEAIKFDYQQGNSKLPLIQFYHMWLYASK
jgi:hypothetical protein